MRGFAIPAILVCASLFFMFSDVWWMSVMALVLSGIVVGLNEERLDRVEAELDRTRAELAQYKEAPPPDHAPRSSPKPPSGDAFLDRLRRLKPSANERKPD